MSFDAGMSPEMRLYICCCFCRRRRGFLRRGAPARVRHLDRRVGAPVRNEQLRRISGIGEQLTTLPMRWIRPAAAWALAAPPAEYGGLLNHRLPGAPPTVTGPHGNSHLLNTHHHQFRCELHCGTMLLAIRAESSRQPHTRSFGGLVGERTR
jgi:hypothetical protein